jgi:hypothetical protein
VCVDIKANFQMKVTTVMNSGATKAQKTEVVENANDIEV